MATVQKISPFQGKNLELLSFQDQRTYLVGKLQETKRHLKPQALFSLEYWNLCCLMADIRQRIVDLTVKIKSQDFEGGESAWWETEEGDDLKMQQNASELEVRLVKKQAERLATVDPSRRIFVKLFITSKLGFDVHRDHSSKLQSRFRQRLIDSLGARHPDKADFLWCPILGKYFPSQVVVAAHIFPYGHGEDVMVEIFGAEATNELFSAKNGLLMATIAEKHFDKGRFVFVPDCTMALSSDNVHFWQYQEVREYVIRLLDFSSSQMNNAIDEAGPKTWKDLDGSKVLFKTDYRPRAHYLYFHYISSILKQTWRNSKDVNLLRSELGLPVWGSPGQYITKNMLLAFVEEIGHDYKDMLNVDTGSGGRGEGDDTLLFVICNQLRRCLCFD